MYREFYGFSEDPFNFNPDPKFLYLALSHWEAFSSIMSGIKDRKGIMVITGEVGVGKTIVLYALLKDLTEKIKTAFILQTKLDFQNMLLNVLQDLEVSVEDKEKNLPSLLLQFRKYLNERLIRDETVTIVVDEAQSLEEEVLEDLFRLSIPDSPAAKLLQILLVGHPELESKLDSEKLRRFKKTIGIHCRIRPLTQEEGRGYINHRLQIVGRNLSEVFTPEAADQVWEFAEGIPRIMNLLCDRTLSIGHSRSRPIIDSPIVKEAVKELGHLRPGKSKTFPPGLPPRKSRYELIRAVFFLISVFVFLLSFSAILILVLRR